MRNLLFFNNIYFGKPLAYQGYAENGTHKKLLFLLHIFVYGCPRRRRGYLKKTF
jgi:hypothetical protein